MSDQSIQIIIPIVTVIISVVTSVIVTALRNKAELNKIKEESIQKFAKSLFDRRVEIYPELYNLFSAYGKTIRYKQQSIENLSKFKETFEQWDSKYSIFFTRPTRRLSAKFQVYLKVLLSTYSNISIQDEEWNAMLEIIVAFENFLRAEIGVLDIRPAGEYKGIERVYSFIDERLEIREKLK